MNKVIYFRGSLAEEDEKEAAKEYFTVVKNRMAIPKGSLVIPRYSALPYYQELETDVQALESTLINSYRQHCYVADLRNWYYDLGDYTPRTWFALDQIPDKGPFFLKGQTNSKKHQWNSHAYAEDKHQAMQVYQNLATDGYIGHQQIYIRQFVPLKNITTGLNGLPISEEYRFFCYKKEILTSGFYWSSVDEELSNTYSADVVPRDFLTKIMDIVSNHINFYVIDVARTATGEWIVIECNDAQQSGLSANKPEVLYKRLSEVI